MDVKNVILLRLSPQNGNLSHEFPAQSRRLRALDQSYLQRRRAALDIVWRLFLHRCAHIHHICSHQGLSEGIPDGGSSDLVLCKAALDRGETGAWLN